MLKFISRRVLTMVISLLGATIVIFGLAHAKDDPINVFIRAEGYAIGPEQIAALREKWGLDRPIHLQYLTWLGNILRGDLGRSVGSNRLVTDILRDRWPATMQLAVAAWVIGSFVGIPLGILSAMRRASLLDYLLRALALSGQSVPAFWIGIVGIWVFAVHMKWLPVPTYYGRVDSGFFVQIQYFILPVMVLAFGPIAGYLRITRSAMLEVMDSEYVKLARAKGLGYRRVVTKHAFRNALIQPITVSALLLAGFMDGAVLVENVFVWPGVGQIAVAAVDDNDFTLLTGIVFLFTILYLAMSFVADILYVVIDPRIRLN